MKTYADPAAFADFLGQAVPALLWNAAANGVIAAAELIRSEAKAEIGHYQDAAGNRFPPWALLAEATVAEKTALGFAPPDNPLLRTGALRDSFEIRAEGLTAVVGSDDPTAYWQFLGTKHIPPRNALGHAAASKVKDVVEVVAAHVAQAFEG